MNLLVMGFLPVALLLVGLSEVGLLQAVLLWSFNFQRFVVGSGRCLSLLGSLVRKGFVLVGS